MAEQTAKKRGLQVEEDRAWQEKFWTAQRIGWALMALFILAALLGATGKGGVLASASAQMAGGATIEYPRITRWQSKEQLIVRLPPSAAGEVELELSRAFVETFSIVSLEPEPSEVRATSGGHRFTFDVGPGGEKVIVFNVEAGKPTMQRSMRVRIGDGAPAEMRLTVLP